MAAVCWIKWWSVKQSFHVFPQSCRKGSFEVKGCHWRRGNWHSHLWLLNLHCQTAEKKIANGSWVLYSFGIVFLNFRSHVTPSIAALDVVLTSNGWTLLDISFGIFLMLITCISRVIIFIKLAVPEGITRCTMCCGASTSCGGLSATGFVCLQPNSLFVYEFRKFGVFLC